MILDVLQTEAIDIKPGVTLGDESPEFETGLQFERYRRIRKPASLKVEFVKHFLIRINSLFDTKWSV